MLIKNQDDDNDDDEDDDDDDNDDALIWTSMREDLSLVVCE